MSKRSTGSEILTVKLRRDLQVQTRFRLSVNLRNVEVSGLGIFNILLYSVFLNINTDNKWF